ncbi:MAG: 3-dehydroquinate synthase [Planctomycetia bacterium]|nr:3-dehydroquinate synthase [Planctomycetia bacterium]
MTPFIVPVALKENAYGILVGNNILSNLGYYFSEWTPAARHAFVISDENVEPLYALSVADALAKAGVDVDLCIVEPGEESKSIEVAQMLWERLIECGADRNGVVVAVGGGVVGDLAGFVAATLNRGMPFIQVPTTLLALVDSSVGGKTGVNLPQGKNLVGAFWQPKGVLADMQTLHTLDDRQFRAGLAEVVKYGVILDANFFAFLEQNVPRIKQRDEETLARIISRCCELKAQIVCEDERETTGRRAILNYGHTFGHAVEKLCGFGTYLHGEAVGIGMEFATRLALKMTPSNKDLLDLASRQTALLRALSIPTESPEMRREEVLRIIRHDKKTTDGAFRFVLPLKLGECCVKTVPLEAYY